ncbi:hypothetical protein J4456_05140 [Candidatus Pacearchaeota archaeon]|nr:hypothetical protein [Candidatus Pacearchaeota archaeon]
MKAGSCKSQITIYIVVIILILSVILLFLLNQGLLRSETVSPEINPIRTFVEDCIMEVGHEGIYTIGKQGGYFLTPEPNIEGIPFYQVEDKDYWPSREKVEEQLALYMDIMLPFCTNGFEELSEFSITEKTIKSSVSIEDDQVYFSIIYPLHISKDSDSYYLKNFDGSIPVRLGILHMAAGEIIHEQMKKTDAVCSTCLYALSEKNKIHIHVMDMNQTETLLFVLRDEQSKILDDDFHYYFTVKLEGAKKNV